MKHSKLKTVSQPPRNYRATFRVFGIVFGVITVLAMLSVGFAQGRGEAVLSEPKVEPGPTIAFGSGAVFSIKVENSSSADMVSVLVGRNHEVVSNLNDIGWTVDEQSFDGIWTGQLDWLRVKELGNNLPLRFEYKRDGKVTSTLDFGTISIVESDIKIQSFDCEPSGQVAISDDLLFTANIGQTNVLGTVVAVIEGIGEYPLSDNGIEPDTALRDGIYTATIPVPAELVTEVPAQTSLEFRGSTGVVSATLIGAKVTLAQPEVYLKSLSIEPGGKIELGQPVSITATLNGNDKPANVSLTLQNAQLAYPVRLEALSGTAYIDGRRQFTGIWEGPFDWADKQIQPGTGFTITASTHLGSRVSSTVETAPFELTAPKIEITGFEFSTGQPLEMGAMVFVKGWTNKPTGIGRLKLTIDGYPHSNLVDNGMSWSGSSGSWQDEVKLDGEWTGQLKWYYNPHNLVPGENLPARVEYEVGDKVWATYELDPVTIKQPDVRIESFYREPSGPIRVGDEIRFIIDLNKKVNMGRVEIFLDDGTKLTWHNDVKGDRVTIKLAWQESKGTGDFGPVTAVYSLRLDQPLSKRTDVPLVVIK